MAVWTNGNIDVFFLKWNTLYVIHLGTQLPDTLPLKAGRNLGDLDQGSHFTGNYTGSEGPSSFFMTVYPFNTHSWTKLKVFQLLAFSSSDTLYVYKHLTCPCLRAVWLCGPTGVICPKVAFRETAPYVLILFQSACLPAYPPDHL